MSKVYLCVLLGLLFIFTFQLKLKAQPGGEGLVLGKTYRIQSKILNEERQIYIYLPDSYKISTAKYPVAYLLDGYEHFHYTSGMVKAQAGNNKMPEMIVVGILNVDRYRDFTPYELSYFPNSGHADKFTQFLQEELFPFIEKYYRTQPHRLLIGHSLGGLFTINTLVNNPSMFNTYIACSPALLHIDSLIKKDYPAMLSNFSKISKSLYFTIGGLESGEIINCTTDFRDILLNNAPPSLKWKFDFMEGEDHTSLVFSSIFEGLEFTYKNWEVPLVVAKEGFEAIQNHYHALSEQFEYEVCVTAPLLNVICKRLINHKIYDSAIQILTQGIELFPKSASLQNNLSVAYEMCNQLEEAKISYELACDKAAANRDPYFSLYVENLNNIKSKINSGSARANYEPQVLVN